MDYKLTIIMSNYNQAHLIDRAIASVLDQKVDFKYQLIITDDYSDKDNSVEVITKYAKEYPDIIKPILAEENGKYLRNILRAKAITKTPYFTLLDADDYWTDENYLQDAMNFLEQHPDFVIYSRDITCIDEQGKTWSFCNTKIQEADYSLSDYLNDNIIISQTTGTVFKNVIFVNGIPKIIEKAIGTISERSFEGDFDRFIMHLKYGKAHFVNKPSGIYNILSTGIWSRLNDFEKNAIQAQAFLDYNEYFDYVYNDYFINKANDELKKCLFYLDNIFYKKNGEISEEAQKKFFNAIKYCCDNKKLIKLKKDKKIKLKYRIIMMAYNYCKKKLFKKGLL